MSKAISYLDLATLFLAFLLHSIKNTIFNNFLSRQKKKNILKKSDSA